MSETAGEKETARIEAFSDGVFAIAITLLIIEVKVPGHDAGPLAASLWRQWPMYLAFLSSFFTIGIMWMNHHRIFTMVRRSDHGLLVWNTLLLLGITVTPFTTALAAEHLLEHDGRTALLVYSCFFVGVALAFRGLWRHARTLTAPHFAAQVRAIDAQYRFGPLFYVACALLALVSPVASLGLSLAIAIFFALPPRA